MKFSMHHITNRGGRSHNEDCIKCSAGQGIFVLADGLGGHARGEVASRIAVESVFAGCAAAKPTGEALSEIFRAANLEVLAQQEVPGQAEMKTTAVALCFEESRAIWAHIGDSRLYHFSGSALSHVTRDHSVTYRKYLGNEISYMEIYHDDDRSSLLRMLGKEGCAPEAGEAEVLPGDGFLLCSDGFWEFVYNEEILADFLKAETPAQWAQAMLLRHIARTPEGNDNFSLITIFVEEGT